MNRFMQECTVLRQTRFWVDQQLLIFLWIQFCGGNTKSDFKKENCCMEIWQVFRRLNCSFVSWPAIWDCQLKLGLCRVCTTTALLRGGEGSTSCCGPTLGLDMEESRGSGGEWMQVPRRAEALPVSRQWGDNKGEEWGSEGSQQTWPPVNRHQT